MSTRTVHIGWEKVFKAFDLDDDDEWAQDYAAEAASVFLNEYDEGSDDRFEVEDVIRDAVSDRVSASIFKKKLDTVADFIEESLNHVRKHAVTGTQVDAKGKRAGIKVTIGAEFVPAAAEIFGGTGLVGDTYSRSLRDVKADEILNAASFVSDVYGMRSFNRFKDSAFDRWEPDTGSHWDLKKIAEKAMRPKRRRR